ncbi:hypothetical protein BZG00_15075 [Salinivibrio kushneri]|uniref:Protein-tyrosine-phosphatase n=1 Tax=Salinivibrio kushneri TaxID=1908198 RepID=A0AB36JSS1_9GAMM|nr:hypothetical protein [Salinivibrio kushneri]OOE38013.1 hypothetical protein BZG00_15075 [Salinivibrio kushneri]QCP02341.1 hypothetical protein FCN78_07980 [Salinivibrio kushneri]
MIDAKDNVPLDARADAFPMHNDTAPSKPVVLFLCDGVHGVSLMAAAVMKSKASSFFDVHCAHTSSTMHTAQASKALIQFQLSTSGITPCPLAELTLTYVDYLVAVNPAAVQSGLPLPRYGKFVPWDVTEHSDAGLVAVLREVNKSINYFLSLYLFR